MKVKEKNGPCRLIRSSRRVYTTVLMQGILATLFRGNEMLSRKELCDQLGQILSEKKLSRKAEARRVLDLFRNKNFIEYNRSTRVYVLTPAGVQFVAKTRYTSFSRGEKPRASFRQVGARTVQVDCKKSSRAQNSRFSGIYGYDGILFLKRLYEHDLCAAFSDDYLKRWIFDLMCAEWHDVKLCKGVSGPTHKQANHLFQKMLTAGLIMRNPVGSKEDIKTLVLLTEKGAECCGFSEQPFIERQDKRGKFEKIAAKVIPIHGAVSARGLRSLKKKFRTVATCSV